MPFMRWLLACFGVLACLTGVLYTSRTDEAFASTGFIFEYQGDSTRYWIRANLSGHSEVMFQKAITNYNSATRWTLSPDGQHLLNVPSATLVDEPKPPIAHIVSTTPPYEATSFEISDLLSSRVIWHPDSQSVVYFSRPENTNRDSFVQRGLDGNIIRKDIITDQQPALRYWLIDWADAETLSYHLFGEQTESLYNLTTQSITTQVISETEVPNSGFSYTAPNNRLSVEQITESVHNQDGIQSETTLRLLGHTLTSTGTVQTETLDPEIIITTHPLDTIYWTSDSSAIYYSTRERTRFIRRYLYRVDTQENRLIGGITQNTYTTVTNHVSPDFEWFVYFQVLPSYDVDFIVISLDASDFEKQVYTVARTGINNSTSISDIQWLPSRELSASPQIFMAGGGLLLVASVMLFLRRGRTQ